MRWLAAGALSAAYVAYIAIIVWFAITDRDSGPTPWH